MKHDYNHIDPDLNDGDSTVSFFQRVEVPSGKTREEAWAELEQKLNTAPPHRISIFKFQKTFYAVAASIILLAGIFSILRFYTSSVYCPAGEHLSFSLPDGSTVKLNADSRASYKKFWWGFARQVEFEGEAYFEVQNGKTFEVRSQLGTTEVLGTSFNIYSRGDEYNVTCITGTVKVISGSAAEAVLSPEYEARVDANGNILVVKENKAGVSHSWVNNMFHFTARPLPLVLNEIGRQFNISITSKINLDYSYTGYFSKAKTPEDILDLVCKPFGLTFVRISEEEYEIYQN